MKKNERNIDDEYVELDLNEDEEATVVPEEEAPKQRVKQTKTRQVEDDEDEDDEDDEFEQISFRNIIGGDILQSKFFLSKIVFIIFCVVLMIVYTGNRYGSLQDIITIDSLTRQLNKVHYEVLTQSSDLLNLSRQSSVENKLFSQGDTTMLNNNTPPFAIPEE